MMSKFLSRPRMIGLRGGRYMRCAAMFNCIDYHKASVTKRGISACSKTITERKRRDHSRWLMLSLSSMFSCHRHKVLPFFVPNFVVLRHLDA